MEEGQNLEDKTHKGKLLVWFVESFFLFFMPIEDATLLAGKINGSSMQITSRNGSVVQQLAGCS